MLAVANNLRRDQTTAEVVGAMLAAGIPNIVLKGPSIAGWLYPSGGRRYQDTDLLVPSYHYAGAQAVLRSIGFCDRMEGVHAFERTLVADREITFVRQAKQGWGPDGVVDLHRSLPDVSVSDDLLWEAFSADTVVLTVGGVGVRVLGRTSLTLHIVLHAVQHGFRFHTEEDLRRAIMALSGDDWPPIAHLAERLGLADILGSGLSHDPVGAEIATRLGLPSVPLAESCLWTAPRGGRSLIAFSASRTVREKLRWIRWILLPSPAKLRHVYRLPDAQAPTLLLAYCRRWRELALAFIPAAGFASGRRRVAQEESDTGVVSRPSSQSDIA
jgi:hypothetical protein